MRPFLAAVMMCCCAFSLAAQLPIGLPAREPRRTFSKIPGYESRPVVKAMRLADDESIKVDGHLDEAAWQRAEPITDFVQQDPKNGELATERTEVRILFNRRSLFLGVTCFDSDPTMLKRNQMLRDGYLPSDDRFMWTIDPLLNGVNGYFFETNPSGAMGDALMIGGSGFGNSNIRGWDGIWYERVQRTDIGWTIEVEIPFQTVAFDPMAPAWGINFQRTVKRKNEESVWNGWQRNQNLQRMTNAGLLEGLMDVTQGKGITVQPFATGKVEEAPPGANTGASVISLHWRGAVGGDLIYSITPTLKADITINTDFAETEVDQRQVNLTQFNLFFPEKRTFFLEGSNFLSFSREDDNAITPYFSRNIGLTADGTVPQRIIYGAKLAGQIGAYDLGFLQVETADQGANTGENFTVFRARRRFLKQSYVGGIFTRRSERNGTLADRYTGGADFSVATSRFRGNQNLELSGFYVRNNNILTAANDTAAYGVRVDYPNDRWSSHANFREIQANWNPAVGFLQRTGVRHYNHFLQFAPRPKNSRYVRRYLYRSWFDLYTDTHNIARSRYWETLPFGVDFQSGDAFSFHVVRGFESPIADFAISNGVVLPQDSRYGFTRAFVQGQTSNRRIASFTGYYSWGSFYSGTRTEAFAGFSVRPRPGVVLNADYDWNRVDLTQGRFSTNLFHLGVNTQFSPFISLGNNIQYDNVSRALGWQSRFRWIVRPGNDVFIVYTHNWLSDPQQGLQTLYRSAATKVVYTHQF